jgi:hypothetical protein
MELQLGFSWYHRTARRWVHWARMGRVKCRTYVVSAHRWYQPVDAPPAPADRRCARKRSPGRPAGNLNHCWISDCGRPIQVYTGATPRGQRGSRQLLPSRSSHPDAGDSTRRGGQDESIDSCSASRFPDRAAALPVRSGRGRSAGASVVEASRIPSITHTEVEEAKVVPGKKREHHWKLLKPEPQN